MLGWLAEEAAATAESGCDTRKIDCNNNNNNNKLNQQLSMNWIMATMCAKRTKKSRGKQVFIVNYSSHIRIPIDFNDNCSTLTYIDAQSRPSWATPCRSNIVVVVFVVIVVAVVVVVVVVEERVPVSLKSYPHSITSFQIISNDFIRSSSLAESTWLHKCDRIALLVFFSISSCITKKKSESLL